MGIMGWAFKIAEKFMPKPLGGAVGLARKILRSIISWAVKTDESLPNIIDTMKKIDPGKAYGEWSQQYRTQVQGLSLEKRLALWPKDQKFDNTIITSEHFKRTKQYRYIFSLDITDMETGNDGWKMYSMYSNDLMSPQEVIDKFFDETFGKKYGNSISYTDYSFYRVQRWAE